MNLKPQFEKARTVASLLVSALCLSAMSAQAANDTNVVAQAQPAALTLHARMEAGASETLKLRGSDARQQLLATMRLTNGALRDVIINNQPLDLKKTYRLGVRDFMAAGGDGYPKLKGVNPSYVNTGFVDADVLKAYIQKHSPIQAASFEPKNEVLRINPPSVDVAIKKP